MMPARVWAMFRRNRLSYAAFCLFGVIVFCSLFAEVIANDRPIVAYYKDRIVLPIIFKYPDSEFNGFLGEADFRDPFTYKQIEANGWMIWPPIRYSYDTFNLDLPTPAPSPPAWLLKPVCAGQDGGTCDRDNWNWLGTDDQGRDVAAGLIYGLRSMFLIGFSATIAFVIIQIAGSWGWLPLSGASGCFLTPATPW
jgi:microcin C transport system permease protein